MAALLKDENTGVRAQAAKSLGSLGPDAKAALPALKEAAKDKEEAVRKAAEDAVELIMRK
jgi:HEAT repeat protein